jgi:hypothetical protein
MLKKIKNPLNKLSGKIAMKKKKCDSLKKSHLKGSHYSIEISKKG